MSRGRLTAIAFALALLLASVVGAAPASADPGVTISNRSPDRYFSPDGDGQEDQAYVAYQLSAPAHVDVVVRDGVGGRVRLLESGASKNTGGQYFSWDGRDDGGRVVPDGVYTYTITAVGETGDPATASGRIGVDTRAPARITQPAPNATVTGQVQVRIEPASGLRLDSASASAVSCENSTLGGVYYGNCTQYGSDLLLVGSITLALNTESWASGANGIDASVGYTDQFGQSHGYTLARLPVTVAHAPRPARITDVSPDRYFSPDGDGQEDQAYVSFTLDPDATTTITIADADGQRVRTIETAATRRHGGQYFSWDGRDDGGRVVPDGVYTYTITAVGETGDPATASGRIGVDTRAPARITQPAPNATVTGQVQVRIEPASGLRLDSASASAVSCENSTLGGVYYGNCTQYGSDLLLVGSITLALNTESWASGANGIDASVGYTDQFGQSHGYTLARLPVTVAHAPRPARITDVSPDRYFSPDGDGQEDQAYVSFTLDPDATTTITIADADGQRVRTIETAATRRHGGQYFSWDGRDDGGRVVPDGVYTYTITAVGETGDPATASGRIGVDTRAPARITQPAPNATVTGQVQVRIEPASGLRLDSASASAVSCENSTLGGVYYGNCTQYGSDLLLVGSITLALNTESWASGANGIDASVGYTDQFGQSHGYTLARLPVTVAHAPRPARITDVSPDRYFSPDGDGQEDQAYVSFTLDPDATTTITIADADGQRVRTIETAATRRHGGQYFSWDGRDDGGRVVPDGVYTYTITAVGETGDPATASGRIGVDTRAPGTVTTPQTGDTLSSIAHYAYAPRAATTTQSVTFCLTAPSIVNPCATVYSASPDGTWRTSRDTLDLPDGANTLTAYVTYADPFGQTHGAAIAVPVQLDNTTPSVELTVTPTSGTAPLTVDTTISAYQPRAVPLDYTLDFGDASTPATGTISAPYEPVHSDHTYANPGVYRMHVSVSDGHGHTAERSAQITVEATGDTTPPETTITDGPTGTIATSSATFAFKASEPDARFECSLDDGQFQPCASPWISPSLADGQHRFSVRATDAAGNADPSPATRTFTIDTTPPETMIDSGPSSLTRSGTRASRVLLQQGWLDVRVLPGRRRPLGVLVATNPDRAGRRSAHLRGARHRRRRPHRPDTGRPDVHGQHRAADRQRRR